MFLYRAAESESPKAAGLEPFTLETSVLMTKSLEHDPQLTQTEDVMAYINRGSGLMRFHTMRCLQDSHL